MIDQSILRMVQNGVCAVGCLTVDPARYSAEPFERDHFNIIGSGFLIRESTVVTNSHVVKGMRHFLDKKRYPDDYRMVQFTYPKGNIWATSLCGVEFMTSFDDPEIDIGFIDITRVTDREFAQCKPLSVNNNPSDIFISQDIAMFGFPEGNELLVNKTVDSQRIIRMGPVLQRGYISALAPTINPPYSRILSDIRTTEGMSGSPVFLPSNGKVLSIHTGSNKSTTSFSIPIQPASLEELLNLHDEKRNPT